MSRYTISKVLFFVVLGIIPAAITYSSDRQKAVNAFFDAHNVRSYNKCGFHIIANYFGTPEDKFGVKGILQIRPTNDASIISGSGKFRIHFDTTDINGNQPFLYDSTGQEIPGSTMAFADSVSKICDYVYHIEVDSLGYPPPPSDNGAGGGNEYDIYIQSLPLGEYGYTDWDPSDTLLKRINPTFAAWTVIRNEFQSTYTKGIPAMEVTIAHEFHHGIQIGNYGLWQNDDLWFYELTSTWMEQVVYPEVKDYYQYLDYFFSNVDLPFNFYDDYNFAGYERCVFGIFVQNEYGASAMKSIWEEMSHERPIPAIEDAFKSGGKDPASMFQLFAQWNYFTNYRTPLASQFNIISYPDAGSYPLVKVSGKINISTSAGGVDFSGSAMRLTEYFYQVLNGADTLGFVIVNNNFDAAAKSDTTNFSFSAGISSGGSNCVKKLVNGDCFFFEVSDNSNWGFIPFVAVSSVFAEQNNLVFPQPFDPSLQQVKIPYPFSGTSSASLLIFGTSGRLLRKIDSASGAMYYLGEKYFTWDGRDESGKFVSSGIYIYVLTDGTKSIVGKIAVVRN